MITPVPPMAVMTMTAYFWTLKRKTATAMMTATTMPMSQTIKLKSRPIHVRMPTASA